MKIAVIGATGYVGNAVVQELAGRGHEVTAFARNTDKVFQAQNIAAVSDRCQRGGLRRQTGRL